MPDPATTALALRRTHLQAPALDVLDLVMRGGHGSVAFGAPPAPFALVVAEAFDGAMSAANWAAWR